MGTMTRVGWAILFVVGVGIATVAAQGTAQINGTVRDTSGGVLPGATVTATRITQQATGATPRIWQFAVKYTF